MKTCKKCKQDKELDQFCNKKNEIDHIHPLSKEGSFHYTNTQPLTVKDNRIKSNKI